MNASPVAMQSPVVGFDRYRGRQQYDRDNREVRGGYDNGLRKQADLEGEYSSTSPQFVPMLSGQRSGGESGPSTSPLSDRRRGPKTASWGLSPQSLSPHGRPAQGQSAFGQSSYSQSPHGLSPLGGFSAYAQGRRSPRVEARSRNGGLLDASPGSRTSGASGWSPLVAGQAGLRGGGGSRKPLIDSRAESKVDSRYADGGVCLPSHEAGGHPTGGHRIVRGDTARESISPLLGETRRPSATPSGDALTELLASSRAKPLLYYTSANSSALRNEYSVRRRERQTLVTSKRIAKRQAAAKAEADRIAALKAQEEADRNRLLKEERDREAREALEAAERDAAEAAEREAAEALERQAAEEAVAEAAAAASAAAAAEAAAAEALEKSKVEEPEYVMLDDEGIPWEYRDAAAEEGLDPEFLRDFFESHICVRVISPLRYGSDIIDEFRADFVLSRNSPIIKMTHLGEMKSRILLPELAIRHTTSPTALDCFVDYKWPKGDDQLLDCKHVPGVTVVFGNCREPMWLACVQSDDEQQRVMDMLTVVKRLALKRNEKFREMPIAPPVPVPLPTLLNGRRRQKLLADLPNHEEREHRFALLLNDAAQRLATSRAVSNYWRTQQSVWVTFWSGAQNKYKTKNLQIFIHPYTPALMVADRKGNMIAGGILNLRYYSCSRLQKELPEQLTKERRTPHVVAVGCMDHDKEMFFSLETVELLKDFQQVVATLSYLLQLKLGELSLPTQKVVRKDALQVGAKWLPAPPELVPVTSAEPGKIVNSNRSAATSPQLSSPSPTLPSASNSNSRSSAATAGAPTSEAAGQYGYSPLSSSDSPYSPNPLYSPPAPGRFSESPSRFTESPSSYGTSSYGPMAGIGSTPLHGPHAYTPTTIGMPLRPTFTPDLNLLAETERSTSSRSEGGISDADLKSPPHSSFRAAL